MTAHTEQLIVTDRRVLEMADRNHQPREYTFGTGTSTANTVVCDQCGKEWPCWTRVKVDEILYERHERAVEEGQRLALGGRMDP